MTFHSAALRGCIVVLGVLALAKAFGLV